jgi:hypothetical protein
VALYLDDIPLDINASSAWCLANVAHTPVFEVGILARQQDRTVLQPRNDGKTPRSTSLLQPGYLIVPLNFYD